MNTDDLTAAVDAAMGKGDGKGRWEMAMLELNDEECNKIALGIGISALAVDRAMVRAGYAAGYRAAQAATPPREPTLHMEPVAWMVGDDASTAAVYNAGEREQAFDAARRWNKSISGLVWSYNTPALQNSQASGSTEGRAQSDHGEPEVAGPLGAATVGITHPETGKGRGPSLAGIKPGPLDHQSAATPSAGRPDAGAAQAAMPPREPTQAMTEGSAADPIADLCARLRAKYARHGEIEDRDAADALERLARERDDIRKMLQNTNRDAARLANIAYKYKWQVRDTCTRAERAEAERDRANAGAARYRWLRDGDGPQSSRWSRWRIEHWASPGPTWADIRGADLDAAIDAHLKEKP